MRSDFLDLFDGVLLGILIGEEAHGSGRSIPGRSAQLCVQLLICECSEAAAGMVEQQYLSRSQDADGDNQLTENILGCRGPAGADDVEIAERQTQYPRKV